MAELSAAEAKAKYFLTPADLAGLRFFSAGVWGAGNTKLYDENDVQAAAIAKHGVEGLVKKVEAREKREDKKRKRAEEAEAAEAQLAAHPQPVPAAGDEAVVRGLLSEARRSLKSFCTWDYLRSKNAPNGTSVTARVERVEQGQYASIIGRAADPTLRSVIKV